MGGSIHQKYRPSTDPGPEPNLDDFATREVVSRKTGISQERLLDLGVAGAIRRTWQHVPPSGYVPLYHLKDAVNSTKLPVKYDASPRVCVACEGSGESSKGGPCRACSGPPRTVESVTGIRGGIGSGNMGHPGRRLAASLTKASSRGVSTPAPPQEPVREPPVASGGESHPKRARRPRRKRKPPPMG